MYESEPLRLTGRLPEGTPEHRLLVLAERLLETSARRGQCALHAGPPTPLAPLPDPVEFWLFEHDRPPEVVGEVRRDAFRSLLARFGVRLFDGQLYGGAVIRRLVLPDRTVRCAGFFGNEGLTGFWLRLFVGGPIDPIEWVP